MADRQDNLEPAALPLDLQLDLLVDEELPESRRRALLLSLDKNPGRWRDLSIRFLERQVEKKTIHQVISGQSSKPETRKSEPIPHNFPIRHWLTPARYLGIAAGLLVAITSALVVIHFLSGTPQQTPVIVARNAEVITTQLPGSIWNTDREMNVKVNVTSSNETPVFFPNGNQSASSATPTLFANNATNQPVLRRTVIIKPDGLNKALIIPVTNLQYQ